MEIFQYRQIHSFNESEFSVYNYVSAHMRETGEMNIRQLALAAGVSTTTVLRFCSKIGCNGYKEFKYRLSKYLEAWKEPPVYFPSALPAIQYLQHMTNNQDFESLLERCACLCMDAKQVIFAGIGTSKNLCEYGANLLSGVGIMSFVIQDPFYSMAMNAKSMQDMILIVLSVSGETPQTISLADGFRKRLGRIVSITNTNQCTIAKMSEINFSYYMPSSYALPESSFVNLTTQIPVVYLLETLRYKIYTKKRTGA